MFSDGDQRMDDDNHTSLGTRYIVLLGANGFKRKTGGIELTKRGSEGLEVWLSLKQLLSPDVL